jgi:hypothetical protein
MASVIPKQLKKDRDQITIKLDRDVLQNLEHYCRYLDSSRDYVINQCLVFIFRKDRTFSDWLGGQGLMVCTEPNGTTVARTAPKPIERKAKPAAAQGRLPIAE